MRCRQGLSPPTRGSRCAAHRSAVLARSIPAHAGEPRVHEGTTSASRVYPRPRGGADATASVNDRFPGLSPPTRGSRGAGPSQTSRKWSIPAHAGSRRRPRPVGHGAGSIPAHAGEPPCSSPSRRSRWVYPRPRGGARRLRLLLVPHEGLSPPTRGSLSPRLLITMENGSIPAHAGEPVLAVMAFMGTVVYPRPRGGAVGTSPMSSPLCGLSPPTRGEPRRARLSDPRRAVYPRPRGGAVDPESQTSYSGGLSPPTRGSQRVVVVGICYRRSIPAHAGEPLAEPSAPHFIEVYPPPTRGSRRRLSRCWVLGGSIPAHAGEPHLRNRKLAPAPVYPRPRGGARDYDKYLLRANGLSPPTRGSHEYVRAWPICLRSIPAHAGEPFSSSIVSSSAAVYPRPRGGAPSWRCADLRRGGLSPPTRGSLGIEQCPERLHGSIPAHAGEPI